MKEFGLPGGSQLWTQVRTESVHPPLQIQTEVEAVAMRFWAQTEPESVDIPTSGSMYHVSLMYLINHPVISLREHVDRVFNG